MQKHALLKKVSAMLSLMLIIAVMVPVLAFANREANIGFSSLTYKSGTVSGVVYSNVYAEDAVSDAVYVNVYDTNKNPLTTVKATYSSFNGEFYYYNFTKDVSNAYNYLNVSGNVYLDGKSVVESSVYQVVYNTSSRDNHHSSSGSGPGGGFISTDGTVSVNSDGTVDAYGLSNALANNDTVTLKLSGDFALIPASALEDAVDAGKTIIIVNDNGSLTLPLSLLDLEALAKALDVSVQDLKIKVSIAKVSDDTANAIKTAVEALGAAQAASSVDFNVEAVGKDNQSTASSFGSTYVARTLKVTGSVDTSKTTGVLYNPATKQLSFVPSTFSTVDGETVATLKRNGSSIYTVVTSSKSFADVASHWSKADVELLANKLVVDGVTDTTFQPDRNITRAEFAALVVRALGLSSVSGTNNFKDVSSSAWYANVVATAVKAGIIDGYEDNTFRPDNQITREELAAMTIRALNYANVATNVSNPDSVLSKFKDSKDIVWAQKEIAAAINAGLINGMTDDTIGSAGQATRAQSATILKRLLSTARFIN
ncbi:S-layer homology domain-containing protein [Paenibacillus sp. TAB 01]|uniref:S-layer homology domain-containing protein n=1 Tax=Paenibacillus sp. TAB 01 TaxID=3368988 RepID=UPI0037519912